MKYAHLFALCALATALVAAAPAQITRTGSWEIVRSGTPGDVRLRLSPSEQRGRESDTQDIALRQLGLTQARLDGPPAGASFDLVRDAGSIRFTGVLGNSGGSGTFSFASSPAFQNGLAARGFALRYPADDLMAATLLDLTLPYADTIRAEGYPRLTYGDLLGFRALGVTAESIAQLRGAFGTISAGDVLACTALHVDSGYVNELRSMGLTRITANTAITFKSLHITKDYIDGLAREGYPGLSADNIVTFKALHIDRAYLARLAAHGFKHLSAQQIIEMKAAGL